MAATIEAAPEVVWKLVTDWERQGDWMLEARDFVVTSETREGIGVSALATVRIAGISTRDEIRVVEWEPSGRLSIEHLGWVTGRGDFHLTPLPGGRTFMSWTERLKPPLGLLGALGLTALAPVMRRIFKRDLRVLATMAKGRADQGGAAR